MKKIYKAIPLDQLVTPPTRVQSSANRAGLLASLITDKLNQMAAEGWSLVTSWKSASGTIFIFETTETEGFDEKSSSADSSVDVTDKI